MQKITIEFYEVDLQKIKRAAAIWNEPVEDFIHDAALLRAGTLLAKRKKSE